MTEFRYTTPEDRGALTDLWRQAFGDGESFIDTFFETAYAPERSRAAVIGGTIAGMLYWFDCSLGGRRLAYVYAVATDKRFRGRGVASGLMADVESLLQGRGYEGVVLCPGSEALYRFYERLGYVITGFRSMETVNAGAPAPVREVEPEEYARLRAEMLPSNGICQEGENLRFLDRVARFYTGTGFCAAVSREGAYFMEFLGDVARIPGLLGALGMQQAAVRMPGTEQPAAMAKWFPGTDFADRIYLGFPFD